MPTQITICRYCGSEVISHEDNYFFECPIHGKIPVQDVKQRVKPNVNDKVPEVAAYRGMQYKPRKLRKHE